MGTLEVGTIIGKFCGESDEEEKVDLVEITLDNMFLRREIIPLPDFEL